MELHCELLQVHHSLKQHGFTGYTTSTPFERPLGHVKGDLSKEMVSDEEEINMGHIHICARTSKASLLEKAWSFTRVVCERGSTVHTYVYISSLINPRENKKMCRKCTNSLEYW